MKMTDDSLIDILSKYGIHQPMIQFIRHNENRTYRIDELSTETSYLLRVHQPFKDNMAGLQHTYQGLLSELEMLESLATQTQLIVQSPIRNVHGDFITIIEHDGLLIHCSLLTWLDGRDLHKEDLSNEIWVSTLGEQTAKLHQFFRRYSLARPDQRPKHDIESNHSLLMQIRRGVNLGLFLPTDVHIVEETIRLINSRLEAKTRSIENWGLIHGDLNTGNVIVSTASDLYFIDFGFFGPGYYLLDVSMVALMVPSEHRRLFLEGYYAHPNIPEEDFVIIEGFMLIAILGYYAFQMDNESVYPWMRERLPQLCTNHCIPFLTGDRIFYNI